jgi:type II secretory pathway pseudopilin PulG
MRLSKRPNGFSFVEILISIILVGLSITALVFASNSFTMANGAGADLSTAEFLIEQIRELTTLLPVVDPETTTTTFGAESGESTVAAYDDVDDFNDVTFSPPIDASRNPIAALSTFTQSVTVTNVSQSDFDTVVGAHASNFVRVTVGVSLNGREISSASWIRANY